MNVKLKSCFSIAAVQFVNRAQLAFVDTDAGSHPQFPFVPIMQLACEIVFAQDVIAIQLIP